MTRGSTAGAQAPSARPVHGDVGRCVRRDSALAPSITADRTAGAGAPMTTMYTSVTTSASHTDATRDTRTADNSSSAAPAMIATWSPDTESRWTMPASA